MGEGADPSANLRLIPLHQSLASAFVWIPVMVLFTRARFDLDGALLLASLYYLFVVPLEVPSGWMSDRFGRVLTLRVAALCWVGAHLCFLLGGNTFAVVALGQLFMAAGFASLSGTDVSFHFDTLESLGRSSEYAERQARVASLGFAVTSLSAVAGGALGLIDLRLAFLASLMLALCQFGVTLALVEPPPAVTPASADPGQNVSGPDRPPSTVPIGAEGPVEQVMRCLAYLADRSLAWIFFYGVIMVTLEHVAVTVLQPWLTEVLGRSPGDVGVTPLFSGLVFALVSIVGAGSARASAPLGRRFGTGATLIGLAALSALIVTVMAVRVEAWVLVLVAFRSAQGAAAPVLISAAVAPKVERRHRATFLSLNSLAGRLGYGLFLLVVSGAVADDVQPVLRIFSFVAWGLVAVLAASAAATRRSATAAGEPVV